MNAITHPLAPAVGRLLLLAGAALAQQPTPAAIAAAQDLVGSRAPPRCSSRCRQRHRTDQGRALQTNPQLAKDLNDVGTQLRTELAPRRGELLTEAARRYAGRFTEQELKE